MPNYKIKFEMTSYPHRLLIFCQLNLALCARGSFYHSHNNLCPISPLKKEKKNKHKFFNDETRRIYGPLILGGR